MTKTGSSYARLALMTVMMFVAMYILMYAMVDVFGNVHNNLNQVYMAGLMTAPMVVIELALMGRMYGSRSVNMAIMLASAITAALFFIFIRQQTAIYDGQFLRSMIPHHAGAILMCEEAPLQDPEIKALCGSIVKSQQAEIDQMNAILSRLGK
ncbi:DUF305 domain-containing protein [Methyloceanibacter sp.]|uniref:DUF305 domain-containing protein n=1 Tax=Methyloceanibacter sp. TaxID=1965321 RepID=UPI003D6CAD8C